MTRLRSYHGGGQGTRFWPLSRSHRPKQVLKILNGKSLLQETVARILPLFGRDKILIVTVKDQFQEIYKQLHFLPKTIFSWSLKETTPHHASGLPQ